MRPHPPLLRKTNGAVSTAVRPPPSNAMRQISVPAWHMYVLRSVCFIKLLFQPSTSRTQSQCACRCLILERQALWSQKLRNTGINRKHSKEVLEGFHATSNATKTKAEHEQSQHTTQLAREALGSLACQKQPHLNTTRLRSANTQSLQSNRRGEEKESTTPAKAVGKPSHTV